jgi:carbon-monoxide dehydrogenase iron sulfur subunit
LKRLLVDVEKCSGCRLCEMVCSFHHEKKFSPNLSRITVIKKDKYGLDSPILCHQCDPCPAIDACPNDALTKTNLGVIHVDGEKCTGCGTCVDACVFDAVKLDESLRPLFCDLCGGEPVCVERCPTDALVFTNSEKVVEHPEEVFRGILRRWGIVG